MSPELLLQSQAVKRSSGHFLGSVTWIKMIKSYNVKTCQDPAVRFVPFCRDGSRWDDVGVGVKSVKSVPRGLRGLKRKRKGTPYIDGSKGLMRVDEG